VRGALSTAAITETDSRGVFLGLGAMLGDLVALLGDGPASGETSCLDGASRLVLESALAEGRGVVFATAHLGTWERMASALVEEGFPIATVARESYDPRFDALYERLRARRGVRVFYRGSAGFTTAIGRHLRRGGLLGFPMDIAGRGVRALPVPFLGTTHDLPLGPATLALRLGAAIVIGTPASAPNEPLRVRIERLPVPAHGTAEALTIRIASGLDERIRALPTAWPWMLVAKATSAPLQSPRSQEISCAKRSTPPSPAPTPPATSVRCR
jgi:KDO2-lipid IV(A) lauroyltransferase